MGERKSSEVIPDNVWNTVVEHTDGNKEVHWKGKEEVFSLKDFTFFAR